MAIDIRKYVNIISGVGGATLVSTRAFITRIFTDNPRVDALSVLQFTNATDVGTFFGTTSLEFMRAVFYFGWISPLITAANMISFARVALEAVGATIFGGGDAKTLAAFTAVTGTALGRIMFVLDNVQYEVTGIDLSTATTFAMVATLLQTAIRAGAVPLAAATVTYDATRNSFVLQDATTGTVISMTVIADATQPGTDLGTLLEWTGPTGAVFTTKVAVTSPLDAFTQSSGISSNFGSFVMPKVTDISDILAVAQFNGSLNVMYQYLLSVSPANAAAWSAALIGVAGVDMTLESPAGTPAPEFPEMCPGIILAATNYNAKNGVMGYEYKQFNLTPSVTDTTTSNMYDAMRVNYIGVTQTAGQNLSFYQQGTMTGGATSPTDQNVFGNEQWFKDLTASQILSLQLAMGQVSPNAGGRVSLMTVLRSAIGQALNNGTISVGNTITTIQQLFIAQITGDPLAWRKIASVGYWYDVQFQSSQTTDGRTVWAALYTLIYAKNNQVRSVQGTHVLI